MAKPLKKKWVCQECGAHSPAEMGRCPTCGTFGSMKEEMDVPVDAGGGGRSWLSPGLTTGGKTVKLHQVEAIDQKRMSTGFGEFDRVLGGGIPPGALALIVGDPGIGKSTLLSRTAHNVAETIGPVLYITGEESDRQIRLRHQRLDAMSDNIDLLCETNMQLIENVILSLKPVLVIVDSIQTMYLEQHQSAPGSVTQVRECAAKLLQIAKSNHICIMVVGHVTKDGNLAGPRVLEHIVDAVMEFSGDRHGQYRILRAVKNRYGTTNEMGVFEHRSNGLAEVPNPSALFLRERPLDASGSVVLATMEGTRPLLVEVQALVYPQAGPNPRITADGIDLNRVQLMIGVLHKRVGLKISSKDAYVKVAGGLHVDEPALDLGLAMALSSSLNDVVPDPRTAFIGEIGLAGEVRGVSFIEQRVREATRLGFNRIVLPHSNLDSLEREKYQDVNLLGIEKAREALNHLTRS